MFCVLIACVGLQLVMALPLDGSETSRQPAVSDSDFRYQVLISQLDERPKCGGVLVEIGFILTSATCVLEFGGIKRFLEEAVLYGGGTSLLFVLGDVSDAVIHPKYMISPSAFDVAVIKYVPEEKSPHVKKTVLNETWTDQETCTMTSWWAEADTWPERLMWQPVEIGPCSPAEPNLLCFTDEDTIFHKDDYGSPIVCGDVLSGLIPRGGGKRAINITSDYHWITKTMTEMAKSIETTDHSKDEETKLYLIKILQRLDLLSHEKSPGSEVFGDHLTNWNNQIVIPLSYVMFAMVIFFFVLLFFIILFTVVLVYYSRK